MDALTSPFSMCALSIVCSALMFPGEGLYAQTAIAPQTAVSSEPALKPAELDSLLAPIALYPDPLVAQILAASTYPLAIVEAQRWLHQNRRLTGEKLVEAAARQDWDPSVSALVIFHSVLEMMNTNLKWTTALGNAFLAQQDAVMASIQRLREKAQAARTLDSNAQQRVEITQSGDTRAIAIEPTQPQVIFVPTYNPAVVFGAAPVYAPYPEIAYPPAGAIVATSAISFGAGVAMESMFHGWSGTWGWNCHWGPRPSLYVNNAFISHYSFRVPLNGPLTGMGAWAHNPRYRRAVPYPNAVVANRYGYGRGTPGPYGSAGVRSTRVSTARASGPTGAAARLAGPQGSLPYTGVSRDYRSRPTTAGAAVARAPRGTYTNPRPSAFDGGGARLEANSRRGSASLSTPRGFHHRL